MTSRMARTMGGTWPKKDLRHVSPGTDLIFGNLEDSPAPADDINEPATEGPTNAAAQSGHQVDVGTPLGYVPDGKQI